ncbi:MAG: biotin/lipoyl-containing protein [Polyangiales bacterium]
MTDKATVTIGAPKAGTIADIRFAAGEVAQVGQVIVVIAMGAARRSMRQKTLSARSAEAREEGRRPRRDRGRRHSRGPARQQLLPDQAERKRACFGREGRAERRRTSEIEFFQAKPARDARDPQARARDRRRPSPHPARAVRRAGPRAKTRGLR